MEPGRFDQMTRAMSGALGRRRLLGAVLASGLGLGTVLPAVDDVEAKKRCRKRYVSCSGKKQCCTKACCRSTQGFKQCFPKKARCCSEALGYGACPKGGTCCGVRPGFPNGSCCAKSTPNCCPPEVNGCCGKGLPVCIGPQPGWENGVCCPRGAVFCPEFGCCRADRVGAQSALPTGMTKPPAPVPAGSGVDATAEVPAS